MSLANNAAAGAVDDFIPAPDGGAPAAANTAGSASNAGTEMPSSALGPTPQDSGLGQTAIILSCATILVLAGLLLLLRNAIRRSLIASRATIDSANAAAWTWYFVLLVFGALMVAGVAGHLFESMAFIGITVGVLIIGVIIAFMMTSRARRSA